MPDDPSSLRLAVEAAAGRDRDFIASPFAAEAARIEREQGSDARAAFLRATLQQLVELGRPRIASLRLPDAVKGLIAREYARVEKDFTRAAAAHYDLAIHRMRCDFRIVGFGRIPTGVEHIELGGLPRRLAWSGNVAQGIRTAAVIARAGGWAPFYVTHFAHGVKPHTFLLVYTPASQAALHRNVAECMRMNRHILGYQSTSWWYDPQLARVAPHLAFLREGALAHGAVSLRAGSTEGAQQYAIANSPERRRLYEAGEYMPVSYAMVWTRQALLRWASSGSA
jgi:hypothetical protein